MSLFKTILTASCLALFAVQFSYNCQRLPDPVGSAVGVRGDGTVAGGTRAPGSTGDGTFAGGTGFNGKPKVHMCPDKRYALQPLFLLTCGRHRLAKVFPCGVHFGPIDSHPAIAMACRLHSLRGPPQQMA